MRRERSALRVVVLGNSRWKLAEMEQGRVLRREQGAYPFAPAALPPVDVTLLFSVNPGWTERVRERLQPVTRVLLHGQDFRPYLPLCYEDPETFGEDRLLLVAFGMSQPHPVLVVDAGTALTVNWVDPRRGYRGGAILPGLAMAWTALNRYTALLPVVDAVWPEDPGCSTVSAMRVGVLEGTVGALRHLTRWLEEHLGPVEGRFLTGGDAPLLASHLPEYTPVEDLPFLGAWWLYTRYVRSGTVTEDRP